MRHIQKLNRTNKQIPKKNHRFLVLTVDKGWTGPPCHPPQPGWTAPSPNPYSSTSSPPPHHHPISSSLIPPSSPPPSRGFKGHQALPPRDMKDKH